MCPASTAATIRWNTRAARKSPGVAQTGMCRRADPSTSCKYASAVVKIARRWIEPALSNICAGSFEYQRREVSTAKATAKAKNAGPTQP